MLKIVLRDFSFCSDFWVSLVVVYTQESLISSLKIIFFHSSVSRLIFKDCSVSGLYQLHLDTPSVVLSARVPCKLSMYWKVESSSLFRTKTRLCLIIITLETEMVTLLSYPVNAYSKLPFLENQRNVHSEFPYIIKLAYFGNRFKNSGKQWV